MTNYSICAFHHILESPSSYMTLPPLPWSDPYIRGKISVPYGLRNPYRNLKSENSQDYAQKPQTKFYVHEFGFWVRVYCLYTVNAGGERSAVRAALPKQPCHQHHDWGVGPESIKYWMVYRRPGFFDVAWFGSSPRLLLSVNSTGDTQEAWERETTCWRMRGERVGKEPKIIGRQESLVLQII